jgi:hypothetical protein
MTEEYKKPYIPGFRSAHVVATGPKEYNWLHIPSGKLGTSEFNEQHAVEADTVFQLGNRMPLGDAYILVNKWNAQQPTVWKFWL